MRSLWAIGILLSGCGSDSPSPERAGAKPGVRTTAPDLSPEEIFRRLVRKNGCREEPSASGCLSVDPWQAEAFDPRRIDARLFGRAWPEKAEPLAQAVLEEPDAFAAGRAFAWRVLDELPTLSQDLLDFAAERARMEVSRDSIRALALLTKHRRDPEILDLCRERIRKGCPAAFRALSFGADPESTELLVAMAEASYRDRLRASPTLRRSRMLASNDWPLHLDRIIRQRGTGYDDEEFAWALEAARRRRLPNLKALLEWRIRNDFECSDDGYILAAYAEAGGTLSAQHELVLRREGFTGDPRALLMKRLSGYILE